MNARIKFSQNENLMKEQSEIFQKIEDFQKLKKKLETISKKCNINYKKIIQLEINNINKIIEKENLKKDIDNELIQKTKENLELLYKEFEKKIQELDKISKNEENNYDNGIPWPQEILEISGKEVNDETYKLDEILIWYNNIFELIKQIEKKQNIGYNKIVEIINDNSIKIIGNYILEKPIKDISINDINIMKNILNSNFINKMVNNELYKEIDILDDIINKFEERKEIENENEINRFTNIIKTKPLNSEFVLPIFKPLDLLFLFIHFTLDNKGSINENSIIPGPFLLNSKEYPYKTLHEFYDKKNVNNYYNFSIELSKSIFIELFRDDVKKINEINNMNEELFKKELQENLKSSRVSNEKKEILKTIEILLILGEKFQKKNKYNLTLNDISFLKSKDNYLKDPEICNKYPSLVYFFLNNPKIPELLIEKLNQILKNENINSLPEYLKQMSKENNSIPFFIFCLRKISSIKVIQYYDQKNIFKPIIENSIKNLIKSNLENKKKISIQIFNFILQNPPLELFNIMTNNFNLFINKIGKIEINLNENLKQIYLKYIDKIITELFEEINNNSLIIEKEFDESNEILNFIKNPSKAVYNFIRKSIEQKINENEVKYKNDFIQCFEKIIDFLKIKFHIRGIIL